MIVTSSLRADVDLLSLAGRDTKLSKRPIAVTGGGEYAGPCPLCGGRDRFVYSQTIMTASAGTVGDVVMNAGMM